MRLAKGYSYDADKRLFKLRFTFDGDRHAVYGRTQKECEEKKTEKVELLKNQMHIENRKITLKQYYDAWLAEQKKEVKPSTVYSYEKSWTHIEKYLGKRKVVDLNKNDVLLMQKKMAAAGSTEHNINRVTRLLKQILNCAVVDRIISFNACNGIKQLKSNKPKAADTNHRALTEEETKLFFKYAKDSYYYNLFQFLLNTGCRIGEALALTWFDVNFSKKEISITKTVSRTSNTEYIVSDSPKNKSSIRSIPMTQELERMLKDQKERNDLLHGSKQTLVFPNTKGKAASYNSVDRTIEHFVDTINEAEKGFFRPFSVHAFRDTFATRCIEQGMQPNTLKSILGHSSLKMTMDLYAHVMPNTKQAELEKISFAV